jgi:hypothetical protein
MSKPIQPAKVTAGWPGRLTFPLIWSGVEANSRISRTYGSFGVTILTPLSVPGKQ